MRNHLLKRQYESRGSLVLEYAKVGDEDIFEGDRQTLSSFMERLRCDTYKGFNFVFGNLYEPQSEALSGILRVYQDQNWLERPDIRRRPAVACPRKQAHGVSNGSID